MSTSRHYLIVRADETARVVSRYPTRLRRDEIAFRLNITYPDGWARIVGDLDVTMPDPPTPIIGEQLEVSNS